MSKFKIIKKGQDYHITTNELGGGRLFLNGEEMLTNSKVSNPNLLINGDFRINQKGQTSYSESNKYTVDRWLNRENSLSVTPLTSGGVKLERTEVSVTSVPMISQPIEHFENLLGKTLTITCKIREDNTSSGFWFGVWGGNETRYATKEYGGTKGHIHGTGIISRTFILPESIDYTRLNVCIRLNSSNSSQGENVIVDWMKLEIGDVATPFSPRTYAEELVLCQRYCYVDNHLNTTYNQYGLGVAVSTSKVELKIMTPTQLRTTPTVVQYVVNNGTPINTIPTYLKTLTYSGGNTVIGKQITNYLAYRVNGNELTMHVTSTGFNVGYMYVLYVDGAYKVKIVYDSEMY